MASPARFIVFEGIDGCGKSTQAARLANALAAMGRAVVTTAEPTEGTATGAQLREALAGKTPRTPEEMALLFTLDRAAHNQMPGGIADSLAAGRDVLCDRYYYSSLAYQGSLTNYDWVKNLNCACPAIRRPDICLFLDLPPAEALARVCRRGSPREIYEREDTLARVRATFLRVFATLPDRVAVIDANASPDEVASRVLAAVAPLF